mgnify:CR=1 FL=1
MRSSFLRRVFEIAVDFVRGDGAVLKAHDFIAFFLVEAAVRELDSCAVVFVLSGNHFDDRASHSLALKALAENRFSQLTLIVGGNVLHVTAAAHAVQRAERLNTVRGSLYDSCDFCFFVVAEGLCDFDFKLLVGKREGNKDILSVDVSQAVAARDHFFCTNDV